ncbi:hypothetical protein AB0B21_35090 [Streptomyces rimosus]|uniref:hypothetical protein n=1 Tax=Streptomyces rimosus TaxID=1927 RepID=UPI00131C8155|nr:hypothetical protein [Streptomyces rimosus]
MLQVTAQFFDVLGIGVAAFTELMRGGGQGVQERPCGGAVDVHPAPVVGEGIDGLAAAARDDGPDLLVPFQAEAVDQFGGALPVASGLAELVRVALRPESGDDLPYGPVGFADRGGNGEFAWLAAALRAGRLRQLLGLHHAGGDVGVGSDVVERHGIEAVGGAAEVGDRFAEGVGHLPGGGIVLRSERVPGLVVTGHARSVVEGADQTSVDLGGPRLQVCEPCR